MAKRRQRAKALRAFRYEVRGQIFRFRREAFDEYDCVPCAVTGSDVEPGSDHVDYAIPFATLVRTFLGWRNLRLEDVEVEPTCDDETEIRLADRALAAAWSGYHRTHAELRIVSANLSLLRRKSSREERSTRGEHG